MISRKEYLDTSGFEMFRKYYGQFVNDHTKDIVETCIGLEAILKSTDRSFNDIPLKRWDELASSINTHSLNEKLKECGDYPTLAGLVCILKESARQIKEEAEK